MALVIEETLQVKHFRIGKMKEKKEVVILSRPNDKALILALSNKRQAPVTETGAYQKGEMSAALPLMLGISFYDAVRPKAIGLW